MVEPVTYYRVRCDTCKEYTADPASTAALATIAAKREGFRVTPVDLQPNIHTCRPCLAKMEKLPTIMTQGRTLASHPTETTETTPP